MSDEVNEGTEPLSPKQEVAPGVRNELDVAFNKFLVSCNVSNWLLLCFLGQKRTRPSPTEPPSAIVICRCGRAQLKNSLCLMLSSLVK